jgi:hypothetical protein
MRISLHAVGFVSRKTAFFWIAGAGLLLLPGWAGSPAQATDAPLPTVQFASATYSVNEDGGSKLIAVKLSAPASTPVSVNFATADGPGPNGAIAGTDYTATSGTLNFPVGVTRRSFRVATPRMAAAFADPLNNRAQFSCTSG